MQLLSQILAVIMALVLCWWGYKSYKNNPELFSKANISKSFGTMGVLALILIAFVGLMVLMLRH